MGKQKQKHGVFSSFRLPTTPTIAMLSIHQHTAVLQSVLSKTKIKQLADIIECFYCVRYATTTRSLARYSSYSRRSLFRFLQESYPWTKISILLLKSFLFREDKHFIAAIDEVVEAKSGKMSFGLSRFYSSLAGKPISGICFFALSLIDVNKACSYFLSAKQVVYTQEDKEWIAEAKKKRTQAKQRAAKGQTLAKGRKKGSNNQPRQPVGSASLRTFSRLWQESLSLLKTQLPKIKRTHLVADSAYSSLAYIQLAQEKGLQLISRLATNAALYQPYQGAYLGKGRRKTYGDKYNLDALAAAHCKAIEQDQTYRYAYYQVQALSKSIKGITLNVGVVKTTHLAK